MTTTSRHLDPPRPGTGALDPRADRIPGDRVRGRRARQSRDDPERRRLVRGRRQGVLESAERRVRAGLDGALHADVGRGLAGLAGARARSRGRRRALTAYVVQLVLNAIWTPVFFGLYPLIGVSALWIGARHHPGPRCRGARHDAAVLAGAPARRGAAHPVLGVGALRDDAERRARGHESVAGARQPRREEAVDRGELGGVRTPARARGGVLRAPARAGSRRRSRSTAPGCARNQPNVASQHRDAALGAERRVRLDRVPGCVVGDVRALPRDAGVGRALGARELAREQAVREREVRAGSRSRALGAAGSSSSSTSAIEQVVLVLRGDEAGRAELGGGRRRRRAARRPRSSSCRSRAPCPRCTSSARAPSVSSIGVAGSGVCCWYRSIVSMPSRSSDPSTAARM